MLFEVRFLKRKGDFKTFSEMSVNKMFNVCSGVIASYFYIKTIAQFRYIKIQPKTIDLSTRLVGITTEFVGFIPTSLVLRSIVLG